MRKSPAWWSWVPGSPIDWAAMTAHRFADVDPRAGEQDRARSRPPQMPTLLSQVSTERTLTDCTPARFDDVDLIFIEIGVGGHDHLAPLPGVP